MSGFFYENVNGRTWDGITWDGYSPYNCWRNVNDSTMLNCTIRNTHIRTADDHGEGMKIDLAARCRIYRTLFEFNDIMHLFFSYPFWGSSLGGVAHGAYCDDIMVEECGFGDLASTFGQAKYFHVQIGGTGAANYPRRITFKNCFALEPIAFIGGNTAGVSVVNLMKVQAGGSVRQAMDNYSGTTPIPPTTGTVEQRLAQLEADSAAFKATDVKLASDLSIAATKLLTRAGRPSAIDRTAMDAAIAAVKASNPKIAASDQAIENALVKLAGELRG